MVQNYLLCPSAIWLVLHHSLRVPDKFYILQEYYYTPLFYYLFNYKLNHTTPHNRHHRERTTPVKEWGLEAEKRQTKTKPRDNQPKNSNKQLT